MPDLKELELERSEIVQEQVTAARDQVKEFQAHFVTIAGPRFLEALDVMNGEFTCCRLGHPHGDPCDREALMLPLLGLYADIYAERHGKHAEAYAFIEPLKHRLFPETFEYVHKGLDGVETTTTQVLFGDLIAAVEDESARTKDFKLGTNAQRHRFYHIHQHGRTSSRLTDLIRSSFRRVNVSGVDDKEPAASEEPVTAPPTARRQLTWRASAPGDYGTI